MRATRNHCLKWCSKSQLEVTVRSHRSIYRRACQVVFPTLACEQEEPYFLQFAHCTLDIISFFQFASVAELDGGFLKDSFLHRAVVGFQVTPVHLSWIQPQSKTRQKYWRAVSRNCGKLSLYVQRCYSKSLWSDVRNHHSKSLFEVTGLRCIAGLNHGFTLIYLAP